MQIKGSVALVTGANRGIGKAFAKALLAAGAAKVYAGARDPATVGNPLFHPVKLDITDPGNVSKVVKTCGDVTLLINNAGVATFSPLIGSPGIESARMQMETNYFGTLLMCRAFAPVLKANGGGALVNMLSVASWINVPMQGGYCASKAAEFSLTNGIRVELREQGTLVVGVHVGYVDTDMTAHLEVPKTRPEQVAERTLEAIEAGREEVLVDQRAKDLKRDLASNPALVEASIQRAWDERVRR